MAKILIVDDEVGIRELLSEILRDEGHDIILAENDYFSMRESNRLPFYDFETGAMLRPYGRE